VDAPEPPDEEPVAAQPPAPKRVAVGRGAGGSDAPDDAGGNANTGSVRIPRNSALPGL
jgi:hypothetical protein